MEENMVKEKELKLIYKLEINQYLKKIQVSKKRKTKYYSKRKTSDSKTTIPNRLLKNAKFDIFGYLLDDDGNRVIANKRTAGTPKYQPINNQYIYSGNYITRLVIVNGLKDYLRPYVIEMPVFKQYPVIVESELHTTYTRCDWDLENFGTIYSKVLNDLIVAEGKLPDDSIRYITKPGCGPMFYPVENEDDRKLVYNFYWDNREEILQLKLWETDKKNIN